MPTVKKDKIQSIENKNTNNTNVNDLIDKINQVSSHLLSEQDFMIWVNNNIKVKKYISIDEKYAIINLINILFPIQFGIGEENEIDIVEIQKGYEFTKLFEILLCYVDLHIDDSKQNSKLYDGIINSGLYNYIISVCKEDYERFIKMLDNVLGIDNLMMNKQLYEIVKLIPQKLDIELLQKTLNDIDEIKLDKLNNIIEMNDSTTKKIIELAKENLKKEIEDNKDVKNNIVDFTKTSK